MKQAKYEIWKTEIGNRDLWYWHLVSANGRILCVSQGYRTKQAAGKGIDAVQAAQDTTRRMDKEWPTT